MPPRGAFEPEGVPARPATDGSVEPARSGIDPAALPLPYMSRRRLAQAAGLVFAAWLVIAFGRQVGQASAATDRADDLRAVNAALQNDVASLQNDLGRVQDGRFIQLEGRAVGLGGPGEIPFTLEAGAPTPGPTAPGSASARLGAEPDRSSPLDGWLQLLFGPDR
jgi:hypothetical protein